MSILCLKTLDTALKEGTLCLTTEFVILVNWTCTYNILLHNIIGRSCVLCEDLTSLPGSINLFQRLLALQVRMLCVLVCTRRSEVESLWKLLILLLRANVVYTCRGRLSHLSSMDAVMWLPACVSAIKTMLHVSGKFPNYILLICVVRHHHNRKPHNTGCVSIKIKSGLPTPGYKYSKHRVCCTV